MPLRPNMEFQDYIQIFLKRKWIIIISFFLVFFGASIHAFMAPVLFKSTTTILVTPQRVPPNYVQSTVTQGLEGRMATIEQQVTSRTMLMKVMEELGLFTNERKEQLQEDVIETMTKRIQIEVDQDRKKGREAEPGNLAFSISFLHEDPKLAMLTASRLASLFIDENLNSRERQAAGTSKLLESQLRETKAKLEAQEERVKRYKMQYLGELPQELQANLDTIARLQDRDRTNADMIRDAEQRRILLQSQLSLTERGTQTIVHDDGKVEVDTSQNSALALVSELTLRRSQLDELSVKYTERHPDVIRLRREVEQLERKVAELPISSTSSNDNRKNVSGSRTYMPLTGREADEFRRLKAQIQSAEADIGALRRERAESQRKISVLQAKVSQAPRREQELISITRDYENLKKSYDDLLKKRSDASISQEMEMRQGGEQFQILDSANLPEKPAKPNRKIIFAFALLMASVLGFGGAIGLENMDLSLRGVTDFKHFFDIPILACIPILENKEIDRRRNLRRKAVLAGIISFALFLFAFTIIYGQKIRNILNY